MRYKVDGKELESLKSNFAAEIKKLGGGRQSLAGTQTEIQKGLKAMEQKLGVKMAQALQKVTDVMQLFTDVLQIIQRQEAKV